MAVGLSDDLDGVPVRVVEADAATPPQVVDLTGPLVMRTGIVGDPGAAKASERGIELRLAGQEDTMMGAESLSVHVGQADTVAELDRDGLFPLRPGRHVKDAGKERGRGPLAAGRDDDV